MANEKDVVRAASGLGQIIGLLSSVSAQDTSSTREIGKGVECAKAAGLSVPVEVDAALQCAPIVLVVSDVCSVFPWEVLIDVPIVRSSSAYHVIADPQAKGSIVSQAPSLNACYIPSHDKSGTANKIRLQKLALRYYYYYYNYFILIICLFLYFDYLFVCLST